MGEDVVGEDGEGGKGKGVKWGESMGREER